MALDANQIRELSPKEIGKKLRDVRHELLDLRLKKKTGQLEKSHLLKDLRRDIARLETILSSSKSSLDHSK
jgi:large subunit ribosomal protein L29